MGYWLSKALLCNNDQKKKKRLLNTCALTYPSSSSFPLNFSQILIISFGDKTLAFGTYLYHTKKRLIVQNKNHKKCDLYRETRSMAICGDIKDQTAQETLYSKEFFPIERSTPILDNIHVFQHCSLDVIIESKRFQKLLRPLLPLTGVAEGMLLVAEVAGTMTCL